MTSKNFRKQVKAVTAPRVQPVYVHSRTEGCFILTFWATKRGTKGQSLKLRTKFHQTPPWQETRDGLKINTVFAMREEVWHAATKHSDTRSRVLSQSFAPGKQALEELPNLSFVLNFLAQPGVPSEQTLQQHLCVKAEQLWVFVDVKVSPKPSSPRWLEWDIDGRSVAL